MRRNEVVNQKKVLKDQERILGGIEDPVEGIVKDIVSGAQTNLARELRGVEREVKQTVMNFKKASVANPQGRHQEGRQQIPWAQNPKSVVIDGRKPGCTLPRLLEHKTRISYRLKS